jgi:hypothetical protein
VEQFPEFWVLVQEMVVVDEVEDLDQELVFAVLVWKSL